MTCIVGVKTDMGVLLGGDTQASASWDKTPRKDVKVFKLSREVAFGFTSSYRMGQIIRYHVDLPEVVHDEYEWAVKHFIPTVRQAFTDHGYILKVNERQSGGTFLLAVRRRLFQVFDDFQVGESARDYDACGCGSSYALGSLYAFAGSLAPRALVRHSLEAAAEFSNGVGSVFAFVETRCG